ncbi:uncharacterized protein LOC141852292 [Brevipalpus obovatus]|uniref:uncharacterized protein LOC141852292 n=1 Tax=Brevipalpus obovatus TaxID=246614 RepID=UPI003D9E5DD2
MLSNIFRTILLLAAVNFGPINSHWSGESTNSNSLGKLSALDVICGKDHMTVRAEFAGPFHGTVSSKGTYGQDNCVYIKPYSGVTHATFKVYYDQCGTKPDLQGKYYENTVVIQYGTDIIEAWDEAKRLRCEWFEAYEKPATFRPAIPVADLDVVEMNFQGDDIDCWMEIQEGKGPWGREVSRIVPVGQPMTIVIAINDYNGQFDMRVKSCFAHDGVKPPIHMTDEFGCVLRPKMLTKFNKVRDPNGKATVISYSHFYAFKFPDSMNVQIQCTVEVCRHGCPDACQKTPYVPDRQIKQQTFLSYGGEQQSSSKQREIPQLAADSSRQQVSSDDKIERNSVNSMKDEDNPSISQDLQNSGSAVIPGQSEIPNSPPINSNNNNANHRNTPLDSSAHQNFESSRISGPVYRGSINGSSSPEDIDDGRRESVSESGDSPSYEPEDKLEEESKLHEKVVNMKIPSVDEDGKVPSITEQDLANLPSGTLDKAAQLFRDLGMNVDMSNFATGFVDGMNSKNLAQILDNDRIRELAESTGIKLAPSVSASGSSSSSSSSATGQASPSVSSFGGGPSDDRDRLPQVQPLVSGPIVNGDEDSVSDNVEDDAEGRKKHSDGYGNRISESASTNSEYWTSPSGSTSPPTQQQNNPVSTSTSVPSQSSLKPNHDRKGQLDGNSTRSLSSEQQQQQQQHQYQHQQHPQPQQPVARPNLHHQHSIQPNSGHTVAHSINLPNRNSAQQPPASILIGELSHLAEQLAPGLDHRAHGPPTGQHRPNERMKNLGSLNGGHRNGHGHIGQQKPLPPSIHLNQAHSTADLAHHLHAAVAAQQQQQQQLQNPVAQIVNIPLGFPPFSITPTNLNGLPNMLAGQQSHLPHRKHMIRDHQNLHLNAASHLPVPQPPRPMNSKPSILASLGNHLPHFNLPSFLSPHIQRQDSSKGNSQGANLNKLHQRQIQMTFPQGPRSFRSRRSPSREPLVNVKRGYQVVTSIDLSFMPNTTDLPEIYSGRREDIVYGVCMPFNGLLIGLTLVTLLVLFALITSLCFMKRLKNLKKQRQMNYIR